jgi:nucleotide-binding universal stress UspA family protein
MFHHVLVPLDGSPQAEKILPYIAWFARQFQMPVTVLSVAEPQGTVPPGPAQGAVARQLQEVVDRLMRQGVPTAMAVAVGRPAQEILRVAEDRHCDLIALSTSTEPAKGATVLGRVADRVFHTSPIPMLLSPQPSGESLGAEPLITTLILPLDGSPLAEAALPYVEDLARKLSTDVVLVRAVPFGGAYVDERSPLAGEVEAATYLQGVAARLRGEGLTIDVRVVGGAPVPHILDVAHHTPQSLIVLTTHGRSAFARWFVGSVAEGVVRATTVPVLIIPRRYSQRYAAHVAELLARTPLLAELPRDDVEHLAETARIRTYHRDEVIVREGDAAAGCFVIASGRVAVVKAADSAKPVLLATLGPGEVFGEMAVIDEHPRSATVRALEETECVAIRREDFLAILQHRPQIAVRLLPILVRRLRQADARGMA